MRDKFTPGPWATSWFGQRDGYGRKLVAIVTPETDELMAMPVAEGVTEDNARLIAAAPDLLAALRLFAGDNRTHTENERKAAAQAAIALAEGAAA